MSLPFEEIAARATRWGFCEAPEVSLPLDAAKAPGAGPLAGLTLGVKSNFRVAGQAWTAGIGAREGQLAEADAPLVARLRGAGARILSRLAMDEGALGAACDNPHFTRCENPAWPGHSPGGSSGGSAAALAAGAVDLALGSDTMGSVRIPAAYCGVFGLKFGAGALPDAGLFPLAPSLDAPGIFARDVDGLTALLDVLLPETRAATPLGWCAPGPAQLAGCTPEVRAFYDACQDALGASLGPPNPLPPMDFEELRGTAFLLTEIEAAQSLGGVPGLSPGLRKLIDYGAAIPEEKARAIRASLAETASAVQSALEGPRVALLPTVAEPAFPLGGRPPRGQADFTVMANVAGCPALALPAPGAHPPVSAQLVGPKGSERLLVTLAEEILARL